jgi:ABC-type multidrug transport system, ATPase component
MRSGLDSDGCGMTTPMLSVEGVSHSYGTRRALDNVTFAVAPATFSVMLGLNGAGKSTLFALITRLYGTQHGRIRILDFDVSQVSSEALRILGVVFQSRTLDLDLTIMQNLMYHASLHGLRRREAEIRAEELLTRIALSDRVDDRSEPLRRADAPRSKLPGRCCTALAFWSLTNQPLASTSPRVPISCSMWGT